MTTNDTAQSPRVVPVEDFEPGDQSALTPEEEESFEDTCSIILQAQMGLLPPDMGRIALMRVTLNGKPEAAIVLVNDEGEDRPGFDIRPLAILISETLFDEVNPR